jgi:hypothetical protein
MHRIELGQFKRAFVTHIVPDRALCGYRQAKNAPQIGDLLAAEVVELGKHTSIEAVSGVNLNLFPGDRIIAAFGNRYATDQYEGYVPEVWAEHCDLLSVGGVCGEVRSAHCAMGGPTRLRLLGAVCDATGRPLNMRAFARRAPATSFGGEVIPCRRQSPARRPLLR